MKLKVYMASAVWLDNVPEAHASLNGARQFTILCRAKNHQEVAALARNSVGHLKKYGGIHEAPERFGFTGEHVIADIVKKDRTIYYLPEHTRSGFIKRWFEYVPKEPPFVRKQCPVCKGSGQSIIHSLTVRPCPRCRGLKFIEEKMQFGG